MSKLIIAEKPELGRAVAEALIGSSKEQGGVIQNGQWTITWAYGHLLSLAEPEDYSEDYADRNDESLLPIRFQNWKKVPPADVKDKNGKLKTDNSYRRNRLALIGKLLKQCDGVVNCGDPDDEGQLLIDEILDYYHYDGPVERVLINDNLPDNIRKQFQNLQDNRKFRSIGEAAYARQMADKCFGISYSRLASIRSGTFLPLGRVMSPTLALVVQRDDDIENHRVQNYYELKVDLDLTGPVSATVRADFVPNKDLLADEKVILDRSVLESILPGIRNQTFTNVKVTEKDKRLSPPLPYNATELQADMNGRYGYSLSDTIAITQSLRDKYKAITYNRSDCQYLSLEHYEQAPSALPQVFRNIGKEYPVDYSIRSACFDDSKVSAHHGIIPQNKSVDVSQMSTKERNVYLAICERYIMQFLPPAVKTVSGFEIPIKDGSLRYQTSQMKDPGFLQSFPQKAKKQEEEKQFLPAGIYQASAKDGTILEKQTKPSPKYTPKSLVKDMCGISKYVKDPVIKQALKDKDKGKVGENGSIGTVATRGAIVDRLLSVGYLEMQGKSIVSTEKGRAVIAATPENAKTPDVTAKWWMLQEQIKKGERDVNAIMEEVVAEFNENKPTAFQNVTIQAAEKPSFGACPVCGNPVWKGKSKKEKSAVWYCSDYKNGCDFKLYENSKRFSDEIKLTDVKVKSLLNGRAITSTLTSKAGKPYQAKLKLEIHESNGRHYANFKMDGFVDSKKKKN